MQQHNPYTLPPIDPADYQNRLDLALESIVDTIQGATGETLDALAYVTKFPLANEELINALKNARRCLLTAQRIAEELKHPRHQDER